MIILLFICFMFPPRPAANGKGVRETFSAKLSHEEINVEEAIRIHGNMVYRLALVQMKNKSEAEDVFQEVFLRLVKYKERIQGREHLKAWLLRVTVNCCKKQFDSAFRKKTVSIDRDVQSTDSYEMDLPENLIYEAVLRLPADYRSTVHLFYYEQYSVSEIAEMLELSESAVKTRLYRSRGMLKEALKGEFDCVGRI